MTKFRLNLKSVATIVACFAVCIILAGCKKDKEPSDEGPAGGDDPKPPSVEMQSLALKGIVNDTKGLPIGGVRVSTGTASAVTKADGTFSFSQAKVVNKRTVISFEKSGYFTLTRSGSKANDMFIEAVLYPKGNSNIASETTFKSSEAKTLSVPAGMKVKLQPSSIMYADGKPYSGTVKADMLYLDPDNENFAAMMPGGDLAAIRTDNSEVMLISWGMTNVNLTDAAGKPLQLKGDSPAEVTYPIPQSMKNNPPPTIPLWHFDENKGIWIEDGVATLQNGVYVGKVSHFSWSNLDEPKKRVTVSGKVRYTYENGKWVPVPYKKVKVGQTTTTTNGDGDFQTFVPENTPSDVEVETDDGEVIVKPIPPTPGGTDIKDFTISIPYKGEKEGEPETVDDTDKGSVKYAMQGTPLIITFDKNGKLFRLDSYAQDGGNHEITIVNQDKKTAYVCKDEKNWEDESEYFSDYIQLVQSQMTLCKASTYQYKFWPKLPANQNIGGKSCKMYSLSVGGDKMTIGVWNGLIMLLEVPDVVPYFAEDATINVPAKAFTTECIIPDWFPKNK